jgi:hypothetical protein
MHHLFVTAFLPCPPAPLGLLLHLLRRARS